MANPLARVCPACQQPTGHILPFTSNASSYVDYYRCDLCGHVWTTKKDTLKPHEAVTNVRRPSRPLVAGSAATVSGRVWSRVPLRVEGLRLLRATLTLQRDTLDLLKAPPNRRNSRRLRARIRAHQEAVQTFNDRRHASIR